MSRPLDPAPSNTPLHVVAIVQDPATIELIQRTLGRGDDELTLSSELTEGLASAAAVAPDVVLVEVAIGGNAGLAVVHHVRALAPQVPIYALARRQELEVGTQAVALGGTGLLLMPVSGDELISAVNTERTRRAERALREVLEREVLEARLTAQLLDGLDGLAECSSRRSAARRVTEVFAGVLGTEHAAVFLRASDASRELMLVERVGELPELPSFCEEMDLMRYAASQDGVAVVRLANRASQQGVLLLRCSDQSLALRGAIERAGSHAATFIALGAEKEAAHRGTMKDPESSAYTFAYFVDVAGREIDKARRHNRRFALATLSLGETPSTPWSVQLAERVLQAVRDTDILARVDEHEFYLLLPETGGIGAHACRRRVMRSVREAVPESELTIGVATYPHDGGDLSQLMRVARHRADASRDSSLFAQQLTGEQLPEVLDSLLWNTESSPRVEAPRAFELPRADVAALAAAAVREAQRSGSVWAVATERPGLSIVSAIRAALGPSSEQQRVDAVDLSTVPGHEDLEAFSLITEHGAYCLLGRLDGQMVRAVHSADPLLTDFVVDRLAQVTGGRIWLT